MNNRQVSVIITLLIAAWSLKAQDPVAITPYQVVDTRNGSAIPCVGCQIFTYVAGSSTPQATYTDSTLTVANTNPVITNSAGYAASSNGTITGIWVGGSCYKFILEDANSIPIWTQDNICDQALALKTLLEGPTGASLIGYEPPNGTIPLTVAGALNTQILSSAYDTFYDACAAAGSGTLVADISWKALTSGTCAAQHLKFNNGFTVQPATGQTVTLPKNTDCGIQQQCFDVSTGGTVAFTSPPPEISTMNYGADPTGVADSSGAINAAIGSGSLHVISPCTTASYNIGTTTIALPAADHFIWDSFCAPLSYNGTGAAVTTGKGAHQWIAQGPISNSNTPIGWISSDSTSIGMNVIDTSESTFFLSSINYFYRGLYLSEATGNVVGNNFFTLDGQDNKISVELSGGGTNQNNFYGFNLRINSGPQCPAFTVSSATNASPIVVTASGIGTAVNAMTNPVVNITGAAGNTAANGKWTASYVSANVINLVGSTGNGAYTANSAMAQVPIAGTAYYQIDLGSANNNTDINFDLENQCVERAAVINNTGNASYTPRLEASPNNSFYFSSTSYSNPLIQPYTDNGKPGPTVQDAGSNGFSSPSFNGGTGFGTGATLVGSGASIGSYPQVAWAIVNTGSAATSTSGVVVWGTQFYTNSVCSAFDEDTGGSLITSQNLAQVTVYGASSSDFPTGHVITISCTGG